MLKKKESCKVSSRIKAEEDQPSVLIDGNDDVSVPVVADTTIEEVVDVEPEVADLSADHEQYDDDMDELNM